MLSKLKRTRPIRFLRDYAAHRLCPAGLENRQILKGFMDGNGWLYSQPKSGTNLIASTLAFYNAETLGIQDYSFDDRYSLGMIHGTRIIRDAGGLTEALRFQRVSTRMPIVRWHDYVPDVHAKLVICTTRNILDQFVSYWHFQYRPDRVSVEASIPKMADAFARRNRGQARAIRAAERFIIVRYEDLIADPTRTMKSVVNCAYGEVDEAAVATALRRSDASEFKKWEQSRGAPFIESNLAKHEKSFIRSGRIGEGEDFFSDEQKQSIREHIARQGIDMSGSIALGDEHNG